MEYPAIRNAAVAVEGDNTVTPMYGYCALKLPAELAGMNVTVSGDNGYKWVYNSDFTNNDDYSKVPTFTAQANTTLVFSVDQAATSATVTVSVGGEDG